MVIKRIFSILICLMVAVNMSAQDVKNSNGDYEFILVSVPYMSQLYPSDRKLPSKGGTYYALSYDGRTAFIYNNMYCGYFKVPDELVSGFDSSVKDLQKENSTLYWQRVKQIMADIDAYWEKQDSIEKDKRQKIVSQYGPDDVRDVAEKMPSFPGGVGALMQYLSSNIQYPKEAENTGVQGRVITIFVVEKDGSISEVKVAKSVHPALDAEAVRVVSQMPKWIPGKEGENTVRVKYTMPITFRLQ